MLIQTHCEELMFCEFSEFCCSSPSSSLSGSSWSSWSWYDSGRWSVIVSVSSEAVSSGAVSSEVYTHRRQRLGHHVGCMATLGQSNKQ